MGFHSPQSHLPAGDRNSALNVGHLASVGHVVDHRVPALFRLWLRLIATLGPTDESLALFAILGAVGLVETLHIVHLKVEQSLGGASQTPITVVLGEVLVCGNSSSDQGDS